MRPDGGTSDELQAWNDRCTAAMVHSWAKDAGATPHQEVPASGVGDPPATASLAAPEPAPRPLEPVSRPAPAPEGAASASPTPDPRPPEPAETVAPQVPEADVRLPYPFCAMDPAEVPDYVWQQARAAKRNT